MASKGKKTAKKKVRKAVKETAKKKVVAKVKAKPVAKATSQKLTKQRVGIFGGSFNPFHNGHLNSVLTVGEQLGLKKIFVVPSFRSPGKPPVDHPSPEDRLNIVELALEDYADLVTVDRQEVGRKGISYTIDTLEAYALKYDPSGLFLILGADVFSGLETWKDFEKILKLANIVVTSRPGSVIPLNTEDFQPGIQPHIESVDIDGAILKSGRTIRFVRLEDMDISATEVRKCLRAGLKVDRFLPLKVEHFIRERGLYQGGGVKISDYKAFTEFCAAALFQKKAVNVQGFDLEGLESPSEFTIVASGTSTRHAGALGEFVVEEVKSNYGVVPQSIEGLRDGRWVLLDYGSLIIHIFYDYVRHDYKLEELFREGKSIRLVDTAGPSAHP